MSGGFDGGGEGRTSGERHGDLSLSFSGSIVVVGSETGILLEVGERKRFSRPSLLLLLLLGFRFPSSEKSSSSGGGSSSSSSSSCSRSGSAGDSLEEVTVEEDADSEGDDDPLGHDWVSDESSPFGHEVVEHDETSRSLSSLGAGEGRDGDLEVDGRSDVGDDIDVGRVDSSELGEDGSDHGGLNVDSNEGGSGEGRVGGVSFDGGGLGEGRAEVENVQSEEGDDLRRKGERRMNSQLQKGEEGENASSEKRDSREATST